MIYKDLIKNQFNSTIIFIAFLLFFIRASSFTVHADEKTIIVPGTLYEFGEKTDYELDKAEKSSAITEESDTYGTFSINGRITSTSNKGKVPSYALEDSNLVLSYTHEDSLLKASKDEYHLVEDDGKK